MIEILGLGKKNSEMEEDLLVEKKKRKKIKILKAFCKLILIVFIVSMTLVINNVAAWIGIFGSLFGALKVVVLPYMVRRKLN